MRIAIPTFGAEIAPRFCYATEMAIVDLDEDRVLERKQVVFGEARWLERIWLLSRLEVDVLVCGGFNRRLLPEAEEARIRVVWGVGGLVDEVISDILSGQLEISPPRDSASDAAATAAAAHGAHPKR